MEPGDQPPEHARTGGEAVSRLASIMARLRGPGGCPWDHKQDHATLRPYVIEEAYEVVDAIDRGEPAALCDELGDLLLQVVFHAEVARSRGTFTLADVARVIAEKLVRRHPHVFGDAQVKDAEGVLVQWEAIKRKERADAAAAAPSVLDGVARALPAATLATRLADRAATVGFDWPDAEGPADKVLEELAEIRTARTEGDRAAIEREVGDLLFAATMLARKLKVDGEVALRASALRFDRRFRYMEEHARRTGRSLDGMTLDEQERLWQEAKKKD